MARAVYIGGFGNGKSLAKGVGEALGTEDTYTFSYAMDNPVIIARAVRGAKLYTHSAGLKAAKDTSPAEITAVAAPIHSSATGLVLKSGSKLAKMTGHGFTSKDAFSAVMGYNASSAAELARHPWGNLKHLRQIAKTDSIRLAADAQDAGIQTRLYFMDRDDFGFIPTEEQRMVANILGVELHLIEGRHDQLPLYPADTLEQIDQVR